MSTTIKLRKRRFLGLGLFGAAIVFGIWYSPTIAGGVLARWDLARGHPRYFLYGHIFSAEEATAKLMLERYGITTERVGYCTVTPFLSAKCDAYNRTVSAHYGTILGTDIFWKIVNEVKQRERAERVGLGL